jgi:hypothetical protein
VRKGLFGMKCEIIGVCGGCLVFVWRKYFRLMTDRPFLLGFRRCVS